MDAGWPTTYGHFLCSKNNKQIAKFRRIVTEKPHPFSSRAFESHQALERRIVRLLGDESVRQVFAEGAHEELRKLWGQSKGAAWPTVRFTTLPLWGGGVLLF